MKPRLVVEAMHPFQAKILNAVARLVGLRNGEITYVRVNHCNTDYEFVMEPSINDVRKNNEEDKMNRQVDKETGE